MRYRGGRGKSRRAGFYNLEIVIEEIRTFICLSKLLSLLFLFHSILVWTVTVTGYLGQTRPTLLNSLVLTKMDIISILVYNLDTTRDSFLWLFFFHFDSR